jgi:hypothetical protein
MRNGTIVCAYQSEQVGKGDVGEPDFQQAVEYRVVGDVVGVKTHLDQNLCDPEVVRRGVKNAIQYRRQVSAAEIHRIPRASRRSRTSLKTDVKER